MSAAARVMLVTGASRGIGAAIARRAAQTGWRMGVNYAASEDAVMQVVEAVRAASARPETPHNTPIPSSRPRQAHSTFESSPLPSQPRTDSPPPATRRQHQRAN